MNCTDYTGEIWKPIVGWEQSYEVSNLGRVKGIRIIGAWKEPRIKRLGPRENEYLTVSLYYSGTCKTYLVHSLVAEAFIGPRPEGLQVNHIDANKTNNHYTNLEYVTPQGNILHAYALGLCDRITRPEATNIKLSKGEITKIMDLHKYGISSRKVASTFGVSHTCILQIWRGNSWKSMT